MNALAEALPPGPSDALGAVRSRGVARLRFKRYGAATVIDDLFQQGCAKLRFPRGEPDRGKEAVLINTAGGLTGGDRFDCAVRWADGTEATVTSQAAERIYRSSAGAARIGTDLRVGAGASARWLPQETILFDGGAVERRTCAEVARGGTLLACESLIVGRRAMGETVRTGSLRDSWRIRHDGRLVFADTLCLDGDMAATLARPSIAGGAEAIATIVQVGEGAESLREHARGIADGLPAAVAASFRDGVAVVRILAASGAEMRASLVAVLETVRRLPQVWNC